jgi:hypothetical protein
VRGQRREVQICTRAATVEEVAAAAELPVTDALPIDRTRECRWGGVWLAANLATRACGPHLLYIVQCDRGPPTI